MKIEAKTEVMIQAFSHFTRPQWDDFRSATTRQEAFDYVQGDSNMRVMERTTVTISGDWAEVTE